jgi:hypothetical protein
MSTAIIPPAPPIPLPVVLLEKPERDAATQAVFRQTKRLSPCPNRPRKWEQRG